MMPLQSPRCCYYQHWPLRADPAVLSSVTQKACAVIQQSQYLPILLCAYPSSHMHHFATPIIQSYRKLIVLITSWALSPHCFI